eukprot:SAG31_NODE_6179_length_2135_cov_1.092338_2_plen_193_part_00
MIAAGGSGLRADEEAKKTVEVLRLGLPPPNDVYRQRWLLLPQMSTARSNHGVCAGVDGRLYALGGLDEAESELSSVEAFSPNSGVWASWSECVIVDQQAAHRQPMLVHGSASHIFVIELPLHLVRCRWALPEPRFGCCAVSIGGASSLAVLGGTDCNGLETADAHAFVPRRLNRWEALPNMLVARTKFGACA